jgi:hypothetical protein
MQISGALAGESVRPAPCAVSILEFEMREATLERH